MVTNETIVNALKVRPEYGSRLLVDKFYLLNKKSIAAFFKIQDADIDDIINKAFLKIILDINNFVYYSEGQFNSFIKTVVFNTARDFLRQKNAEKNRQKENDIEFIPYEVVSYQRISEDAEDENLSDKEENEGEFDDFDDPYRKNGKKEEAKDTEIINAEDFDLTKARLEYEFLYETDTIPESDKMRFVQEIFDSFSNEDQIYLRLYLNNVPHKEISQIRKSSEDATRKHINRLLITFFQRSAEKLNKNYKELYENFKKQNK